LIRKRKGIPEVKTGRTLEIIQSRNKMKKEWRKNEKCLTGLWDTITLTHGIKGTSEGKGVTKSLVEATTVAKNVPNMD
jgi:hypothetical protein